MLASGLYVLTSRHAHGQANGLHKKDVMKDCILTILHISRGLHSQVMLLSCCYRSLNSWIVLLHGQTKVPTLADPCMMTRTALITAVITRLQSFLHAAAES